MAGILRRLRAAAPNAEIIVTGTWNFNADDLKRTDPLFRSINASMARVAASADAWFAATFPAFNPQGSVARGRARICSLTFICSRDDPHPTDAGYRPSWPGRSPPRPTSGSHPERTRMPCAPPSPSGATRWSSSATSRTAAGSAP